MPMPMIYISREAEVLLSKIEEFLKKNVKHGRIIRADIITEALKVYAKEIGLEATK